jgi:hypothetical protein
MNGIVVRELMQRLIAFNDIHYRYNQPLFFE